MMNSSTIWEISSVLDNFLLPEIEKDGESLLESNWGSPLLNQWKVFKFKFQKNYGEQKADFHFLLGYIPIISVNICSKFNFESSDVELLPIENISGERFFVINPCFCDIHILNNKKSKIEYDSDGNISWILEPVFSDNPQRAIFKIPHMPTKIYVDDSFVNIAKNNKWKGIVFIPRKKKHISFIHNLLKRIHE